MSLAQHDDKLVAQQLAPRKPLEQFAIRADRDIQFAAIDQVLEACEVVIDYRDEANRAHHWQGGRLVPKGEKLRLTVGSNGEVTAKSN